MQEMAFLAHVLPLLQHMLLFLGLAYLFTKTPVFTALVNNALTLPDKILIYVLFSGFCILGTYFSEQTIHSDDAISNTRAIGAVLGGLLGGPLVGLLVGATGGLHRMLSLSSPSDPINYIDIACALATTCEGLLAGFIHYWQLRKGKIDQLFSPRFVLWVTLLAESVHMLLFLLLGLWVGEVLTAWELVKEIAPPMLLANSLGVALIIYMIREQRRACDQQASSKTAWQIASKIPLLLHERFDQHSARQMATIIQQQTRVGAVAITDRERLLAFSGIASDHHLPGTKISSSATLQAISESRVIFLEGVQKNYQCRLDSNCPLGSVLIIPLRDEANNEVFGTIKLYEPRNKLFRNINHSLGESIAQLLSNGILAGRYQVQQQRRIQDQYKILTTQVNPHFLYNALTTIGFMACQQGARAQQLLQHLSDFFRKSLEQADDTSSVQAELEYVNDYLEIEKARFEERLRVKIELPTMLLKESLPVFTLQPIVENAIKHGISQLLSGGAVTIGGEDLGEQYRLWVEDNAGLYCDDDIMGMGLKIDERIKMAHGEQYGLEIVCQPQQWTRVNILLPKNRELT